MRKMTALEAPAEIRKAQRDWAKAFRAGAEKVGYWDAPIYWHDGQRVWGGFSERTRRKGAIRTVNRFGLQPNDFAHTTLIQVNPPDVGKNLNRQGLFAHDGAHRWALHLGRMHPAGFYVSGEEFATYSATADRVVVRFADGSEVEAHAVANIDVPEAVPAQVAEFVRLCERIRLHVSGAGELADEVAEVVAAENAIFPEPTEPYVIGPKDAVQREHHHGRVFAALRDALLAIGVHKITNTRVGKFGPDLYVVGDQPVLFEVKATASAASVQQGLGQLLLYEKLLKRDQLKVLVLPDGEDGQLELALKHWEVRILRYGRSGQTISFRRKELRNAIKAG